MFNKNHLLDRSALAYVFTCTVNATFAVFSLACLFSAWSAACAFAASFAFAVSAFAGLSFAVGSAVAFVF